jgi:hypothetical protein
MRIALMFSFRLGSFLMVIMAVTQFVMKLIFHLHSIQMVAQLVFIIPVRQNVRDQLCYAIALAFVMVPV